jgi:hypothetical protein
MRRLPILTTLLILTACTAATDSPTPTLAPSPSATVTASPTATASPTPTLSPTATEILPTPDFETLPIAENFLFAPSSDPDLPASLLARAEDWRVE